VRQQPCCCSGKRDVNRKFPHPLSPPPPAPSSPSPAWGPTLMERSYMSLSCSRTVLAFSAAAPLPPGGGIDAVRVAMAV
jgi:hypothetical protein